MPTQPLEVDATRARKAEAAVQEALDSVSDVDEITGQELEEFRQQLPTDPQVARLAKLGLPFPWSELVEYVSASERQRAYWRVHKSDSAAGRLPIGNTSGGSQRPSGRPAA